MPLVSCDNLTKRFRIEVGNGWRRESKTLNAVDDVSLAIDAGETLGLVGESGCGKTTLGRCLVGLTEPSSGEIWFGGQRVDGLKGAPLRALCRERQIVFQDPYASLDPRWRIGAILDEPLRVHGSVPPSERPAEVLRLLDDVGLPADIVNHFPHEFSGGQRQRIGIARALSLRPKFVVADEPVSALDVSVRAQILNLLTKARSERNLALLFITHDLGAVRQISHRIAVMYLGAIVEESPTEALFENPRHPYTRALLSAIPRAVPTPGSAPKALAETADVPSPLDRSPGCRFSPRCPFAQALCRESEPALASVGASGHRVACHFAADLPPYSLSKA